MSGISKPRREEYAYKRRFYQDPEVAACYDQERFAGPVRAWRNRRKWRTVATALDGMGDVGTILDLPCGTGRFTGHLARRGARVVGSDISLPMLARARESLDGTAGITGYVQAEAERLPFRPESVDCAVCIRFMHHVDAETRVEILRELARVARRLVVDYRHRYTFSYAGRKLRRLIGLRVRPLERVSRSGLQREFREAGLSVRRILPVARLFSDKWIVVAGPAHGTPASDESVEHEPAERPPAGTAGDAERLRGVQRA